MGNVLPISISISIDDLVTRCGDCTARQAKYACEFEENHNALKIEWQELTRKRNDVKSRVIVAEEQHMKRLEEVEGWLQRVEKMEADIEKLIADGTQQIENRSLRGCCPMNNCKSSYKLGKKVANKLAEVGVLKSKGVFEEVAYKLPITDLVAEERPSEPTVGLESIFDEVWSCTRDESVGIIGLYGLGGVGKTTLLKKINNKLCNTTHDFDAVIWVVVSKNPNPIKVQDDIGRKMGFQGDSWNQKSQDEKAVDIFRFLKRKKFVLLLDDLWDRFELTEAGIPLPNRKNKSKVLFTTRSTDVCGRMEAHKINVKCLGQKEAWDLFQEKAGKNTINAHPEIPQLAKTLAEEADGLPLALITIGRAMACKTTPREWRHAIATLQKSAAEFSGLGDEVFPLLKFSYDSLRSDTVKSCFLYCSLFPEDYLISKEGLIEYWVCEGFFNGFDDLTEATNEGHHIIGTLIHACLLEENSSEEVKMHDVIRDMALWIACECGTAKDKFLVQAGAGLKNAPEVGKWKGAERMSLMKNSIVNLTQTPTCPNLLTLFLSNNNLRFITRGFFQNMPHLRVLDLSSNARLSEVPVVEISELVSLQYLNLSRTDIRALPIEFKKLVGLEYLNLDSMKNLNVIPQGVMPNLKKLQVLKINSCGFDCLLVNDTVLSELECLKDLNNLSITIGTTSLLSRFLSSPRFSSSTTSLTMYRMGGLKCLDMSFLESRKCLDMLEFQECEHLEDMTVGSAVIKSCMFFDSLRTVVIHGCKNLRELTCIIFARNLDKLDISQCERMQEVIHCGKWGGAAEEGGAYLNLFTKLKTLHLYNLPELKSIYPKALPLPCLKSVTVRHCLNLKKIPLNRDSAKGCGLVIEGSEVWWNKLEWEDEATPNALSFRQNTLVGGSFYI